MSDPFAAEIAEIIDLDDDAVPSGIAPLRDATTNTLKIFNYSIRDLEQPYKKVLFVCHDFPTRHAGGAQLYARDLARAIHDQTPSWRVDVLYPSFRQYFGKYAVDRRFRYDLNLFEVVKDRSYYLNDREIHHREVEHLVREAMVEGQYDLVHIHGLGELSIAPLEVAHDLGIPVVATLHDFWFICPLWFLRNSEGICSGPESVDKCARCLVSEQVQADPAPYLDGAERFVERRRDRFLRAFAMIDRAYAPSRFVADIFARYGCPGVEPAPLGLVPSPRHIGEVRKPGRPVITYLGNLSQRKRVDTVLEAYAGLANPRSSFLELHGKSQSGALSNLVRDHERRNRRIKWFGGYSPGSIPQIMARSDVVVVPSDMETFSIVIREAFQHRVPVIAAAAGGMVEAFEDGVQGFYFRPLDVHDLREKLQTVIDDPTILDRMRENIGPVRSIDEDADAYVDSYEQLVGAQRSSS